MRNKNVESLRAISILILLFYHYTVSLSVFKPIFMVMLNEVLCQFVMITFFIISGYGTFLHYKRREDNGETIRVLDYFKSRWVKIAPAYYLCLIFLLLFTSSGIFISRGGLKSVLVYGFMLQNLFPSLSGDINGVTWTIALFIQFYLISYPMYKLIKVFRWKSYPLFLVFSLLINKVLCGIIAANGDPDVYYVIASIRQIFTTVDIFAVGMICGSLMDKKLFEKVKTKEAVIGSIVIFIFSTLLIIKGSFLVGGLWGDGFKYYLWKPLVSIVIGCILLLMVPCKIAYQNWLGKGLQFVARNEYNTYLWHMALFGNLMNTSGLFNEFAQNIPFITALGMMALAVIVGSIVTKLTTNLSKNNMLK